MTDPRFMGPRYPEVSVPPYRGNKHGSNWQGEALTAYLDGKEVGYAQARAEIERLKAREAALIRVKDVDLDDLRDEMKSLRAIVSEDLAQRIEMAADGTRSSNARSMDFFDGLVAAARIARGRLELEGEAS